MQTISVDQQQHMMLAIMDVLQAYARTIQRPFSESNIQNIRGQAHVKRALEVAAAGGHHSILVGPPGSGKGLLARTMPSLLPATTIPYPFRAPYASSTIDTFVGKPSFPGELTLAHGGILFLEHLHLFDQALVLALQRTMKTHIVTFDIEGAAMYLPARFILVATILPCPCGFYKDPLRECHCTPIAIEQYQQRKKEIIDPCFDIQVEVPLINTEEFLRQRHEESAIRIRERVESARMKQQQRFTENGHLWVNADLASPDEVQHYCHLDLQAAKLLNAAIRHFHMTPRNALRFQKLARTIADLANSENIQADHMAEAIQYRSEY